MTAGFFLNMIFVSVCVLSLALFGVEAQIGYTSCTFTTQANCPNFLTNSYCNLATGKCECADATGYVDAGFGVSCTYQCDELVAPENGAVDTSDGRTTDDVATYSCDDGYTINGANTSTCVQDVGWDNIAPTCETATGQYECEDAAGYVDDGSGVACTYQCDELVAPENGAVDTSDGRTTDDVATYSCDDGYTINGANTSTCVQDVGWDNNAPTCEPDFAQGTPNPFRNRATCGDDNVKLMVILLLLTMMMMMIL